MLSINVLIIRSAILDEQLWCAFALFFFRIPQTLRTFPERTLYPPVKGLCNRLLGLYVFLDQCCFLLNIYLLSTVVS